MTRRNGSANGFLRDTGVIVLSILVAVMLLYSGILHQLLQYVQDFGFVSSFVIGLFFTSVFTTAPAIAAFIEVAHTHSPFLTAFFGALGAMCGDFLIFRFMRDRFSTHLTELIQTRGMGKRLKHLFRLRFFHWLTLLLGGIIIASPLPDELGLSLLGFSKIKTSRFLPISFAFNFIGILLISLAARAIAQP